MQFWALVVDSFRESLDRKIFWAMLAITLIIAVSMACIGFKSDSISLMFGMWEIETAGFNPLADIGRTRIVGGVLWLLMDHFMGWAGIILMIVATAGMFPAMMDRGGVDVLLAKPLSRAKLFLYKYLATMVFAFMQATFFVVLTFLVMGFRWGVWVPGYLLSIPLLVLLFSYVYCVSVLVAVKTRSTIAAILLSIGAWTFYAVPPLALYVVESRPEWQSNERIYQAMKVAAWIPPKTAEIPYIAARWANAGISANLIPDSVMNAGGGAHRTELEHAREIEERELKKNPWISIGSSLLFEAVIVLWAMAIFARKDY